LIRKIQIEKLNTELDYLKAQINPHFLFNSINTIYFQIDKQNTTARETLLTFPKCCVTSCTNATGRNSGGERSELLKKLCRPAAGAQG